MARIGRPPKPIDWDVFDGLCELQCTQVEIASWFDMTVDTIHKRVQDEKRVPYSEYYEEKASKGCISLRRKQWQVAMKGDKTMLIWLGKQYLSQKENQDFDVKLYLKQLTGKSDQELAKEKQELIAAEIVAKEKRVKAEQA